MARDFPFHVHLSCPCFNSNMASHFSIRSPGWQFDHTLRNRREHLVHFMFCTAGEVLAREYRRYNRRPLWPEILAFLEGLDALDGFPVQLVMERDWSDSSASSNAEEEGDGSMEGDNYYVWAKLPNPGWEKIAHGVVEELEREVQSVWKLKTALSLKHILEEALKSAPFLLRAVLAFSETHGTSVTREYLEAQGMLS
jgi:hypothetical protein